MTFWSKWIIREKERCPTQRARGRLDSHRHNGFFMALSFIRFGSDSRPASRRYPVKNEWNR